MPTERRRQLILAALVIVLLAVIYRLWTATSPAPVAASNRNTGAAARPQTPRGGAQPARTRPRAWRRRMCTSSR